MLETRNTWDWLMKQTDSLGEWSSSLLKGPHEHAWGAHDLLLLRSLAPGTGRDAHTVRVLAACIFPRLLEPAAGLTSEKTLEAELRERRHASHLKSDVIELAATADRRSARMDHAVHRNDARAALRGSPGPFPGGAPRRGAAGCGFAFYSLLARHFTRFLNELLRTLRVICAKKNPEGKVLVCSSDEPWNLAPLRFWVKSKPAPALVAPLSLPALPRSADGSVRAGATWRKTASGAQSSQGTAMKQEQPKPHWNSFYYIPFLFRTESTNYNFRSFSATSIYHLT